MRAFLPDQTHIRQVHLSTADLGRALGFYSDVLGLKVAEQRECQAMLSAEVEGPGLIVLSEIPGAAPRRVRSTGLCHFALRYPQRRDLAQALRRLLANCYPVAGTSDHGVSEAIYLADPEGNGVELYVDRPRSQWPRQQGQLVMDTNALDLGDLLGLVPRASEAVAPPAGVSIGHVHLNVADLTAAERFFGQFLGLAVTQRSYRGALFFAAGDYHHHIGVNTWADPNPPPPGSVGLVSYLLEVPVAEVLYCLNHRAPLLGYETRVESAESGPKLQVRDPSGTWLEIRGPSNSAGLVNGTRGEDDCYAE